MCCTDCISPAVEGLVMIRGWNFKDNIIKFLPLLLLYLILVILFSADTFQGDEGAYIRIATRLAGLGSPTIRYTYGLDLVILSF